jgi:hypothetical protein
MANEAVTEVTKTYPVRTDTALHVRDALIDEQYKRRKQGPVSLMAIAAEWLEEIAIQKRDKRE